METFNKSPSALPKLVWGAAFRPLDVIRGKCDSPTHNACRKQCWVGARLDCGQACWPRANCKLTNETLNPKWRFCMGKVVRQGVQYRIGSCNIKRLSTPLTFLFLQPHLSSQRHTRLVPKHSQTPTIPIVKLGLLVKGLCSSADLVNNYASSEFPRFHSVIRRCWRSSCCPYSVKSLRQC